MSTGGHEAADPDRGRLLKASDFSDQLRQRDPEDVRQVLGLPNVDAVIKELQRQHGIRIGLSPALVRRFQQAKAQAAENPETGLQVACPVQDICIFCDQNDRCETCDMMDWCSNTDTHVVAE